MNRWPAEWESQSAVLLTWPHSKSDWQPMMDAIEACYRTLASAITKTTSLLIICHDAPHQQHVEAQLTSLPNDTVRYLCIPTNDTWIRDYGPISTTQWHDFSFNGWGGRFSFELDQNLTSQLVSSSYFDTHTSEQHAFILEGGSIESDGQGTCLTTRRCLLNANRNPTWTQKEIESYLGHSLGFTHYLWLDAGEIIGDDTDGHIDMLARFCSPTQIIYQPHENDTAFVQQLQQLTTAHGTPYALTALPIPPPSFDAQGQRLPLSYANFLITNGQVIAPTYDVTTDQAALDTLAACFPQHEITAVNARPLVHQGGSIHCATMHVSTLVQRQRKCS